MALALNSLPGFTYGCDPEVFVLNEEGKPVCPSGFLPGTKEEPFKVTGGAVQIDGMAAEFNIDPVDNFDDWNYNIDLVLKELRSFFPKGYKLSFAPAVEFGQAEWDAAPDSQKVLGCSPDHDAWTGKVNHPPERPKTKPTLCCAGGHIHVGWTNDELLSDVDHLMNCRDLVKQMDWHLGGWSISADPSNTRRELYGKAGACRYKPYGVEYRVLSNFWVKDAGMRLRVWNRMMTAITTMRSSFLPATSKEAFNMFDLPGDPNDILIESINTSTRDTNLDNVFSRIVN